jgi:hypothetical protein
MKVMVMINEGTVPKKEKKVSKVILILLVGLASISGAKKDLNELLTLANNVHAFANHWLTMLPLDQTGAAPPAEVCQVKDHKTFVTEALESRSGQGKSIKIKRLTRDSKTVNGRIAILLPADLETDDTEETLNSTILSEFPLTVNVNEAKAFDRYDWQWQWRTRVSLEDLNQ